MVEPKENDTLGFEERLQKLADKGHWSKEETRKQMNMLKLLSNDSEREKFVSYLEKEEQQREQENKKQEQESQAAQQKQEKQEQQQAAENSKPKEKTPEERAEQRENRVPTDEFKDFMETKHGEGAFENKYLNGSEEEKNIFETQYETLTGKDSMRDAKKLNIEEETKEAPKTNQEQQTDENLVVNEEKTDQNQATQEQEAEWKTKRLEAWKEYAEEHKQEFKVTSEAKSEDLGLQVGDTSIHYKNESNVAMSNAEYEKFVKLVEIEQENQTDIINFGKIKSEDYKSKLAAACLEKGMMFRNGPDHIDLSLDCFKNIAPEVKAKIEKYNEAKAKQKEKQQENQQEQTEQKTDAPKETTEENTTKPAPEEENKNSQKTEDENQDSPKRDKEFYKKLYEEKLAEFQRDKPEKVDVRNIEDAAEKAVIYAAAQDRSVKAKVLDGRKKFEAPEELLSDLPEFVQKKIKYHDENIDKNAKRRQNQNTTGEKQNASQEQTRSPRNDYAQKQNSWQQQEMLKRKQTTR